MTDVDPNRREALAAAFEDLAAWCAGSSPLYERLARAAADDAAVLAVAAAAPPERSAPHLLLAAVHDRLLAGVDHPLAAFYGSVTDDPLDPTEQDPYPAFRAFCLSEAGALREVVSTRRTQTNAVRRSAVLYPAFAHVARASDAGGPLAVVEVGPSAGLNLLWDAYDYAYDLPDGGTRRVGAGEGRVTVASTVRSGDPPLPANPPAVASRVGVDRNPVDVTDDREARWLRALVWPEHDERRRVLRDALAVAREDPPRLVAGDGIERLPDLVGEVPHGTPVCVFDTLVRYQLPEDADERYRETVRRLAGERDLHWLTGPEDADDHDAIGLTHRTVADGEWTVRRLGRYEPHGAWVEWA